MMENFEKPVFLTEPVSSQELLEKNYYRLKYDVLADERYHFTILLNKEWKIVDTKPKPPNFEVNMSSIALFKKNTSPQAEIEVLASIIPREVNPSDWLELYLNKKNANIIDGRAFQTDYGTVADFLALIEEKGKNLVIRAIAIKDTNRIFALMGRAYENDYPTVAENFLMAVTSFELVNPTKKRFAEKMEEIVIDNTVKGSFLFPGSWEMKKDKYNSTHVYTLNFYNYKKKTAVGVFTFSAISKAKETSKENLMKNYLSNFTDNGFTIQGTWEVRPGEWGDNTSQAIVQLTDKKGNDFEVTAILVEEPNALLLFALMSYDDVNNYDIHIINKRAYEIAFSTFSYK